MKIAVDARTMGSIPSGIGMYTYNFLCEFAKYPELELILISDVDTSEQMQEMKNLGIPVYLYGKQVFRSAEVFRYFAFVKRILNKIQPDIFWEPNNLLPKKMAGYRGKIVLTVHDIFPVTTPQYFGFVYRMYFRIMLRRSLNTVDVILYDSNFSKKEVETIYPFTRKKQHFLSYVIIKSHDQTESEKNGEDKEDDKNKETTKQECLKEPYFLYIGNIEQRKGCDLLLKAYERYRMEGGHFRLLLGGAIKGKGMKEILDAAMKQIPQIEYLGYVSDEQKATYIKGCEAFLFPSKAEGFGMPLIEVMEYGKPVIARELPIFRELIGNCICYFKINEDEEKEISEFVELMCTAQKKDVTVDEDAYRQTLNRYNAAILGNKLVDYIKKL